MKITQGSIYTLVLEQEELDSLTELLSKLENAHQLDSVSQQIFNNLITYYAK